MRKVAQHTSHLLHLLTLITARHSQSSLFLTLPPPTELGREKPPGKKRERERHGIRHRHVSSHTITLLLLYVPGCFMSRLQLRRKPGRVCTTRFWSTPSPFHFLHAILYGWSQPPKNAFVRPPETRTTGTDCPPTLQSGPRYPRGRACPVGWSSAAPIPVDTGHHVCGGRAAVWTHSHLGLFVESD